jgi:hypothetical protein
VVVFFEDKFQSGNLVLVLHSLDDFANAPIVFETIVYFLFGGQIPVLED